MTVSDTLGAVHSSPESRRATAAASVSIVVPAYNCEPYLQQAVRSVQAQSMQDFEIIIVDDGSTDGTLKLAMKLASEDGRVRVYTQANSGGPATPRNRGISLSTGDLVAFLDPDDYWYAEKLRKQVDVLVTNPEINLVFSDSDLVTAEGTRTGTTYLGRAGYAAKAQPHLIARGETLYIGAPSFFAFTAVRMVGPVTSGVVTRRNALDVESCWFPVDIPVCDDNDLWFRLIERGNAAFIDEPLYAYRQHSASLTQNVTRLLTGQAMGHARNFQRSSALLSAEERQAYRKRIAELYFSLGYHERRNGNTASARAAYKASGKWIPSMKTAVAYVKTFVPRKWPLRA